MEQKRQDQLSQSPHAKLIVFEGPDASGKGTHIKLASEWLTEKGVDHVAAPILGGSPTSAKVRELLIHNEFSHPAEMHVALAGQASTLEDVVKPALAAGKHVLVDRYLYTFVAYQIIGRERNMAAGMRLMDTLSWARPDLCIIFTAPMDVLEGRRAVRHAKRMRDLHAPEMPLDVYERNHQLLERTCKAYDLMHMFVPNSNYARVNSDAVLEAVAAEVRKLIMPLIFDGAATQAELEEFSHAV